MEITGYFEGISQGSFLVWYTLKNYGKRFDDKKDIYIISQSKLVECTQIRASKLSEYLRGLRRLGILETATKPDGSLYYGFPVSDEKVKEILKEQFNRDDSKDTHRELEAFVEGTKLNSINIINFIISEIKKTEGYFRLEGNQKVFLRRAKKLLRVVRELNKDDVSVYSYLNHMIRKTKGTQLGASERMITILNLESVARWMQENSNSSEGKSVDSW